MKLLLILIVCLGVLSITLGCLTYSDDKLDNFSFVCLIVNSVVFGFNVNTLLSWRE